MDHCWFWHLLHHFLEPGTFTVLTEVWWSYFPLVRALAEVTSVRVYLTWNRWGSSTHWGMAWVAIVHCTPAICLLFEFGDTLGVGVLPSSYCWAFCGNWRSSLWLSFILKIFWTQHKAQTAQHSAQSLHLYLTVPEYLIRFWMSSIRNTNKT